jgi:hypothetical protein
MDAFDFAACRDGVAAARVGQPGVTITQLKNALAAEPPFLEKRRSVRFYNDAPTSKMRTTSLCFAPAYKGIGSIPEISYCSLPIYPACCLTNVQAA